jgi:hypothetical protein
MPHALHSTGLPFGPLRHCGELVALQWQHGPATSCLTFLPRPAAVCAVVGAVTGSEETWSAGAS